MWQYSSKGNVAGITSSVDMNLCFVPYPKPSEPDPLPTGGVPSPSGALPADPSQPDQISPALP